MQRIIVTADIHGSYTSWLTVKSLMNETDALMIAGDLFDTKYGSYADPDFQPEAIKEDLKKESFPLYYVYGNCDVPRFYPGHKDRLNVSVFDKKIYLHHGHRPINNTGSIDLVIQGHTHLCSLEKKGDMIHLNPGSIAHPRNAMATYGIIDKKKVSLVRLKTGEPLVQVNF